MKKMTAAELPQPQIVKYRRTLIRIKHSLVEGQVIDCVLPDTLEELDALVARGELKEVKGSVSDAERSIRRYRRRAPRVPRPSSPEAGEESLQVVFVRPPTD